MKKAVKFISATTLFLGVANAQAVNYASGQPPLCAIQSVSECVAGQGCDSLMPYEVNLPDFFVIDPASRLLVTTPDNGVQRKTPIEYNERLDGKLMLQGADDGIEDVRDGVAWSMAIDEETGRLVMTVAGDAFALAAFGACTLR